MVELIANRGPLKDESIVYWLKEGRITYCEDIVEGLENAPGALIGLLKGENFGKVVVRVAPESKR